MSQKLKNIIVFSFLILSFGRAQGYLSDFQSFSPNMEGLDFITTQSPYIAEPGSLYLGVFLDNASNTLLKPLNTSLIKSSDEVKNNISSSQVHLAYVAAPWISIGFETSHILSASVNDTTILNNYFQDKGVSSYKINSKIKLVSTDYFNIATYLGVHFPQIMNNPYYGGSTNPIGNIGLIIGKKMEKFDLAGNVNYHFRNPGDQISQAPYEVVYDLVTYSIGSAYRFEDSKWSLSTEVFGSLQTKGSDHYSLSELAGSEILVGGKYDYNKKEAIFDFGLTTQIDRGLATSEFRGFVGFNWRFKDVFGKSHSSTVSPTEEDSFDDLAKDIQSKKVSLRSLNFATNSYEILSVYDKYLQKVAQLIQNKKYNNIIVSGHTDASGNFDENIKLSRERARSVSDKLIQFGVPKEKIKYYGMGSQKQLNEEKTVDEKAQNRRVEIEFE
jgi:outer membrane protein OmpA-like peptidoglycan-associated protein